MTGPLLAATAAMLGVFGAWETLTLIEQLRPARAVGRALAPLRLAGRVGRMPTVPERRRLAIIGAGALLVAGWLLAGPVAGFALAAAGPAAVGPVLAARHRRWRRALGDGAPGVARALADALAGGHAIRGALEGLGADSLPGVAGAELRTVAHRLALGVPTEEVLIGLRDRAAHPAWDTLVAAILLQREAGGDLAALLRSIAEAAEHARRVEADARGLTAQARATARLVAGLPCAALALGELLAPGTLGALVADARSRLLLLAGMALAGVALAAIGRIARVGGS
ncbi:type II secretion system F family protein [Baekduia sp.]|uniref:type II secretion system F family protein n=1 Tax=Baekduia sp. TaxID=2600305 RepID=UPI002E032BE6|nr:type II secretion system F family protein [Baekduia sp.]